MNERWISRPDILSFVKMKSAIISPSTYETTDEAAELFAFALVLGCGNNGGYGRASCGINNACLAPAPKRGPSHHVHMFIVDF